MGYTHIDDSERRRIEKAINSKKGVRAIARMTGRSPSTISEELKRNSVRNKYTRQKAEAKAKVRRKNSKLQCLKVAMDSILKEYVLKKMKDEWSPELIAGRIKMHEKGIENVSTKAIYKFVHSVHGRNVEKYLYSRSHRLRSGPKRGARKVSLDGRTMIGKRPRHIENRKEFGHFEGDFMESGRDGTGSLLHLVERKTRYPFLEKVADRRTNAVNRLAEEMLEESDPLSLTVDNDLSFAKHVELSELLDASVYFCNPYHSWEKGTVENRNRAVRKSLPKGTDFSLIGDERVKEIETQLRNRPLKILGFKTPQEAWEIEITNRASQKIALGNKRVTMNSLSVFSKSGCSA